MAALRSCVSSSLAIEMPFSPFHRGLSNETRYWRYFSARRELPESEVQHFTVPKPGISIGIAAWLGDEIIGHACYDKIEEEGAAEAAFEVADLHQGRGLGTALFEKLAREARKDGLRRFIAQVLVGNRKMLKVFQDLGLAATSHREDSVIRVEIELGDTDAHQEAARARAFTAAAAFKAVRAEHGHLTA